MTSLRTRLASALASRFILDLRLAFHKPNTTDHLSTIHFAPSLIANMGAPLGVDDSVWASGAADDVATRNDWANHREEVDDPFRAGLKLGPSGSEAQTECGSSV